MSSNLRVAVYLEGLERPRYHVKFRFAKELIASGRAVMIDFKAIRLVKPEVIVETSNRVSGSNQGAAYEGVAIDANRRIFQGGLTRNEHQPAAFSAFKGARVGHQ
jgi:hypothetical protein